MRFFWISILSLIFVSILSCKDGNSVSSADNVNTSSQQQDTVEGKAAEERSKEELVIPEIAERGYLHMGILFEAEQGEASFTLKNVSDKPQIVGNIEPTCECIKIKNEIKDTVINPGDSLEVNFVMDAVSVGAASFERVIIVNVRGKNSIRVRVCGVIYRPTVISPSRDVDLGLLKNPAEKWTQVFTISGAPGLKDPLVLGEPKVPECYSAELKELAPGEYELTVSSKSTLPYKRNFEEGVGLPIKSPEKANYTWVMITAHVGEAVNFAPDSWKISRAKLEESGQFTERFAYGEVPGLQEEKNDGVKDLKNMMKRSLLRQHNAVPLKFVKENHDWDDLFANLQYEVPAGVSVEKIRHPQGIELRITVTKEAFANDVKSVAVVPYRDINRCAPINIQIVE